MNFFAFVLALLAIVASNVSSFSVQTVEAAAELEWPLPPNEVFSLCVFVHLRVFYP